MGLWVYGFMGLWVYGFMGKNVNNPRFLHKINHFFLYFTVIPRYASALLPPCSPLPLTTHVLRLLF